MFRHFVVTAKDGRALKFTLEFLIFFLFRLATSNTVRLVLNWANESYAIGVESIIHSEVVQKHWSKWF